MVNQARKNGSEALRPMSNNAVPVLFSLKNVQPLILGASPVAATKEKGQSADAPVPMNSMGASAEKANQAGTVPNSSDEPPIAFRPTKVQSAGPLLRTVGTVLLILLVILVVRMSVPSGAQDEKIAASTSSKEAVANSNELASNRLGSASVQESSPPMPSLPHLGISVPTLPALASSSGAGQSADELVLAPKEMGLELAEQKPETSLRLGYGEMESGSLPKPNTTSPVPALLAAAPSNSMTSAQSAFPQSETHNSPSVPSLDSRETNSTEMILPYTNAPEVQLAPYGVSRPEIRSTNNVRETSTPNLDNMDELFSLYRKGKEDGISAQDGQLTTNAAPSFSGNVPARQVSMSNSLASSNTMAPTSPPAPYVPIGNPTNWPTNSLSPASLTGMPSQGVGASPAGSAVNNSMPMAGQSYPPPQRVYEPLTVPAYEQAMTNSSSGPNGVNRYQSSMIRQPSSPTTAPIAQPRMPYSPVGPTATGTPGASYGYPPINVPSN
jgi:hypothetical protein